MRLRVLTSLSLVCVLISVSPAAEKPPFLPPSRTFEFIYSFAIKNIPDGARVVRVWVPVAQSDQHQTVKVVNIKAPAPTQITEEPEYGNKVLYVEIKNPPSGRVEFTLEYEVTRLEYSRGDYAQLERKDSKPGVIAASMNRYVQPDALVPIDGKIKALAVEVTGSQTGTVAKAKAAYSYLFTTMRYDKTGTGWGRGDAIWACDAKHGNCTDFHSPFIGVMRADGIPARFDIGFPVPENKAQGDIAGYHCWAEFYAPKVGWVPVDISEAWKAKEKRDYFFGTVDANRVQFSTGRDITLVPKQDGPPLNYFAYPYVEVDGKPDDAIEKQFSFEEVLPSPNKGSAQAISGRQ